MRPPGLWFSTIIAILAMTLPISPGYAQSSQVSQKARRAKVTRVPFQAKNHLGVYIGYKSVHAKEGLFVGRQVSPRFMVSANVGLPFSPDIRGKNDAMILDGSTEETPPELMTISTYQTISVFSSRLQFFPRPLTTYPSPLMDGFYVYQTLDITKHNMTFKTVTKSSPTSTGDFHVIGGGSTSGVGYYFMPTTHIFVDFSYILGFFHSFIKSYGFSGDQVSSKLQARIFKDNRNANPLLLREPPYHLGQVTVSVGYIF